MTGRRPKVPVAPNESIGIHQQQKHLSNEQIKAPLHTVSMSGDLFISAFCCLLIRFLFFFLTTLICNSDYQTETSLPLGCVPVFLVSSYIDETYSN